MEWSTLHTKIEGQGPSVVPCQVELTLHAVKKDAWYMQNVTFFKKSVSQ